jgi:hypothetical protein
MRLLHDEMGAFFKAHVTERAELSIINENPAII